MNTKYIETLPLDSTNKMRIKMTTHCADCDHLPRVRHAGKVIEDSVERYQVMHNGLKVVADGYIGTWVTEIIKLLKGFHEPQEEKAFSEILKYIDDNATMVELGSWWAYYSLWFQREIKNAKNYLIEPDPNNLEIGKRNFSLNKMTGHHFNFAIGKESIDSIQYQCYESDNIEREIRVLSVDDFIQQQGIPFVDLLLADIQGFELDMLRGATKSIERGIIRFIVLSTHHHLISNDPLVHQKCLDFFHSYGAKILVEHTVSESYSGDGLIIASFSPQDKNLPDIEISRNRSANSLFREVEYDLADSWATINNLSSDLSGAKNQINAIELDRAGIRDDLLGVRRDLSEIRTEREFLLQEIGKERDEKTSLRHELDTVRDDKFALKRELSKVITDKEKLLEESSKLKLKQETIQSDLVQALTDVVYLRNENTRLRTELAVVISERDSLQKEYSDIWLSRHHYWSELDDIYRSHFWRITAPFRAFFIFVNFWRERFQRIRNYPANYIVFKILDRIIGGLGKTLLGKWIFQKIRDWFPNWRHKVILWLNRNSEFGKPQKQDKILFEDITILNNKIEHRLLKLFKHEISIRQKDRAIR